jgi:HPt (histidine-containing phosphotransfer) domain-containing protein
MSAILKVNPYYIKLGSAMTHLSDLDTAWKREHMFLIRSVCFIGGLVYPLWSLVYQYILPEARDPVSERLLITALAGLNIALTFFNIKRSTLILFLYGSMLAAMGHLVWISYHNDFHPYYQIGILVLICATLPFYDNLKALLAYIGITSIFYLALLPFYPLHELVIFYVACSTVYVVSTYASYTRLALIRKLNASRAQFAESADRIAAVNRDVSSIMENIQLGVLTIESQEGIIGKQYSHALEEILGYSIPPQHSIFDILIRTDLSADHVSQVRSVVSFIGDDSMEYNVNSHILPQECQFKNPQGESRIFELEWGPIVDPARDIVQKILVSIRDVTEFRKLMHQNEEKKKELQLILEIVALDKVKATTVFTSIKKLLDRAQFEVQQQKFVGPETMRFIFREVHTIKGLARSFYLHKLASLSHEVEDQIQKLKHELAPIAGSQLQGVLQPLHDLLGQYTEILTEKFGIALDSKLQLSLSPEEIDWIINQLRTAMKPGEDYVVHVQEMYDFILNKTSHSLQFLLKPFFSSMEDMARELHKPMPRIEIKDDNLSFAPSSHDLLQSIFAHLLRNSIDHGIEEPAERLNKGKPAEGLISITIANRQDALHIHLKDDGRGLNLDAIRKSALSKGLLHGSAQPSREELSRIIFMPDFTTKSSVSSISGRGIGMDAVQAYLKSFEGTIAIEFLDDSTDLARFQFHITLPHGVLDSLLLKKHAVDAAARGVA